MPNELKIAINALYVIFLKLNLKLSVQVTNDASDVTLILYILGLRSTFIFIFFSNRRTLKFLTVKCNLTSKKIVALIEYGTLSLYFRLYRFCNQITRCMAKKDVYFTQSTYNKVYF